LGATLFGSAPIEPASEVCVFGCGPIGLSSVQGARIKGASRIIAIEPIPYRRQLALQLGATHVLDPNAEGKNLLSRVRELCTWPGNRRSAGGRFEDPNDNDAGPDYVIEAVGGNAFPAGPGAALDPDPSGLLPMMQAWELCTSSGHLSTLSTGQLGDFRVPGPRWSIGSKNHHPGNMNGSNNLRDIPRYARLIATGQFNAKAIASATYSLDQIREGFKAVVDRTTVAAIVTFS
jgi:S-(hydroxymethyl)glutathione dehydrogenase/alcohol dehydrogenase